MIIHRSGGDPKTVWDKVSGLQNVILTVEEDALAALGALADRVEGKSKAGALKKATKEIERDVALQLAILARCFELQDNFSVIELDHVLATAPEAVERHRLGIADSRRVRRESVLEQTSRLMLRLDAAGGIAGEHILLHAGAARSVVDSLNATATVVDDFRLFTIEGVVAG